MTVKELIENLNNFNPNLEVIIEGKECYSTIGPYMVRNLGKSTEVYVAIGIEKE